MQIHLLASLTKPSFTKFINFLNHFNFQNALFSLRFSYSSVLIPHQLIIPSNICISPPNRLLIILRRVFLNMILGNCEDCKLTSIHYEQCNFQHDEIGINSMAIAEFVKFRIDGLGVRICGYFFTHCWLEIFWASLEEITAFARKGWIPWRWRMKVYQQVEKFKKLRTYSLIFVVRKKCPENTHLPDDCVMCTNRDYLY